METGRGVAGRKNGILTAEDVSTLDLQGTCLATLSAWDTGSGEGVMFLRRGFIQAGAQNLLMTLWPRRHFQTDKRDLPRHPLSRS
jgi:CHAT domain-containing protein